MKLFVWEGSGVLTDYSDGLIVAVAPDLESALKAIEVKCYYAEGAFPPHPTTIVDLDQVSNPQAWLVWGGG